MTKQCQIPHKCNTLKPPYPQSRQAADRKHTNSPSSSSHLTCRAPSAVIRRSKGKQVATPGDADRAIISLQANDGDKAPVQVQ